MDFVNAVSSGEPRTPFPPSSVFDLNTKAVVSIKAGRIQEGLDGLTETLCHVRTLLLTYQEAQPQPSLAAAPGLTSHQFSVSAMECDCDDATSTSVPPLSLFTVPLYTNALPLAPGDADSAHCPLFDRAFVMGGDTHEVDDDEGWWLTDVHCQNVTVGVLLYNAALCHHLLAIQKGATSMKDYQAAVRLYQMALSLLENSFRHEDEDDDVDGQAEEECHNLVVLLCAIFNNMANIHSRHFHVNETRSCVSCLKEVLDCYNDSVMDSNSMDSACVEEDHVFFYLNLYVTAPAHDFAIAPAA